MELEQVDGGGPPLPRMRHTAASAVRLAPSRLDDDSWDLSAAWLNSNEAVDESNRYHGRRRTRRTGAHRRGWSRR